MINFLIILFGFIAALIFFILPVRYKIFSAIFTMTTCFNLVPGVISGIDITDAGHVMLIISGIQLIFFIKPQVYPIRASYLYMLLLFTGWMIMGLLWALVVYQYPVLNTLKAARHMILGYMTLWVLIRLFRVDPEAYDALWELVYGVTFVLLVVFIVQYITKLPLLVISAREYKGATRQIPYFLPFCLMYFWTITSKFLSGIGTSLHNKIYALLTVFVIAVTYTRGIYFSVLIIFTVMIVLLLIYKRLNIGTTLVFFLVSIFLLSALLVSGVMDRVISRALSGVKLMTSNERGTNLDDSYSGRMAMVRERFDLVVDKNPFFGYAFIHEMNLPHDLKTMLQHMHGSVIYTDEYVARYQSGAPYVIAFHSADEGWADLLIDTGVAGTILFILFIIMFIIDFHKWGRFMETPRYFYMKLGMFLQVLVLVLWMFNGTPFISEAQIPAFMIAGCAACTLLDRDQQENQQRDDHVCYEQA